MRQRLIVLAVLVATAALIAFGLSALLDRPVGANAASAEEAIEAKAAHMRQCMDGYGQPSSDYGEYMESVSEYNRRMRECEKRWDG